MIPYVAELERRIVARQEQDAEVRRLGEKAVDVDSVTVIELLRLLDQYGPRTEERCVRELTLDDVTLQGYIEAMLAKGFVDTGRTKRGSTVVMIAEAGREHLRLASDLPEPDPGPSLPVPRASPSPPVPRASPPAPQNVSADDAKLPVMTGGAPSVKGTQVMSGNGTGKSGMVKLREAHTAYEKACSELAKAHARGEREEIALIWNDVTAAEVAVAEAKAHVLSCLFATPEKATKVATEKKPATAKPAKKTKPASKKTDSPFSNWLIDARTRMGLSQVVFGQKIGASETQMWNWENGRRTPGEEYVAKIERLTGKTCPYRQKAAG